MPVYKIRKGLSLPLKGRPSTDVITRTDIKNVGILGDDFPNLKPSLLVKEGDVVKKGQPVFFDRKNPSVVFTAVASGTVKSVNRGEKRKFLSLVIEKNTDEAVKFNTAFSDRASALNLLKNSGLLTFFRKLPFAVIPDAEKEPDAVFINCMDTRPLAPDMRILYKGNEEYFSAGVRLINLLSKKTYVCCSPELIIEAQNAETAVFEGKHPAGLSGTHVHFLRPASLAHEVWTVDMQTAADIGYLILHGELNESKIIAVGGETENPCHIKTVKGAGISELIKNIPADVRVVNGSVLYGFSVTPDTAYLTSVMNQISLIKEQTDRPFMGWLMPGAKIHSVKNIFLSKILCEKNIEFDTSLKGCHRAMVPVGIYEKVMPLDILPTHLLRALVVKDYETAEKLGCLELSEEDLSLCTYVCPGKTDFAPVLRSALNEIEKEG